VVILPVLLDFYMPEMTKTPRKRMRKNRSNRANPNLSIFIPGSEASGSLNRVRER
jgi:hypothetical protein